MLSLLCKALLHHSSRSTECYCWATRQTTSIGRKGWFNSVPSCYSPLLRSLPNPRLWALFGSRQLMLAVHPSPSVYGLPREGMLKYQFALCGHLLSIVPCTQVCSNNTQQVARCSLSAFVNADGLGMSGWSSSGGCCSSLRNPHCQINMLSCFQPACCHCLCFPCL